MRISDWSSDVCSSDLNNVTSDFLNRTNSFSQELRANGTRGDINWVVGGYFYRDSRYNQGNVFDGYAAPTPGEIPSSATQGREGRAKRKSVGVFAHLRSIARREGKACDDKWALHGSRDHQK